MARGPGPVAWVHRLLIVTALVAAVVYCLWEVRAWARGTPGSPLAATLALLAAVALAAYLRSLRTLRARLTPRDR